MDRKLDRKKPFATIYGQDPNTPKGPDGQLARYQQNGMYFDQFGGYVSGEYKPADAEDVKRDLQSENARLRAELEALKKDKPEETKLDKQKIMQQLKEKGVKFNANQSAEKLYELLQSKLDEE